ncbi:AsnC family transcriptional regulator [Kribbella turkmenica]|uniref:AsnC family transcriptional regulator n=1 Tax=Kribbella turkmenica TaxID=2530375 RepID=A0A4R4XFL6_9ACTN|nr:AsnC family transcriptional regulator [Kribbella turkmenica]TDD29339.1 AsnC family transcriptional regulator [Kribbella turkmenica]
MTPEQAPTLDDLDRRIVAALQVDGRAPWSRIADVLGESERTVMRRGAELIARNVVRISALFGPNAAVLVRAECAIGAVRTTATALAQRSDSVFAYALTGTIECVAEIRVSTADLPALVLDELPATVGLVRAQADPILRVLRSVRQWRPPILNPAQIAALETPPHGVQQPNTDDPPLLSPTDRAIVRVLAEDGRASLTTIALRAGISESTARRRLEWLQNNGHLWSRAVVEPRYLGYPVEAILWIRVLPGRLESFTARLVADPHVREAIAIAGEFDLAVNVAVPDQASLYGLVAGSWRSQVQSVQVSVVLQAMKRSGVRVPLGARDL